VTGPLVLGKPAVVRDQSGPLVIQAEADGPTVWLTVRRWVTVGTGDLLLRVRPGQGDALAAALVRAGQYASGKR